VHANGGSRIKRSGWRIAKLEEEASGILGGNWWRCREEVGGFFDSKEGDVELIF
jgi:hypothetical protein